VQIRRQFGLFSAVMSDALSPEEIRAVVYIFETVDTIMIVVGIKDLIYSTMYCMAFKTLKI
jgi:hypothetical protein